MKNTRNSSIECIKIFAVVLIVLCHAVPDSFVTESGIVFNNNTPTANALFFLAQLVAGFGLVGDVIFIVCSSYFLSSSKSISIRKIASMIITVFLVSVTYLVIFLALGYKMSALMIVKQIFPTIFQNNWFISYYIVFYLLHPLFNAIIQALDKKRLAIICALLFVHCSIVLFVIGEPPGVNKFLCFVNIYFIVAYMKFYGADFAHCKKLNIAVCAASAVLYFALRTALNFIGLEWEFLNGRLLAYVHINNPIIIAFALSLFNLANMKCFVSKPVNFLSSLSLLIYIIHKNNLLSLFIQPLWFEWFVGNLGIAYFNAGILLLAIIYFAGSVIIASGYRFSIERAVNLLSAKIEKLILCCIEKIKLSRHKQSDT